MPKRLFFTMPCILLCASLAHAENWPEFRGPSGQGIATANNLPSEWSSTKNVAGKQRVPGSGWSSPIIWDDRIYLTSSVSADGGDQSLRALCLDAKSGKTLWDKEVFHQNGPKALRIHSKNSHAS